MALLSAAVVWVWCSVTYLPEHLMRRTHWVTVTVDGHPTNADVYLGQPTEQVAEAYVLVHAPSLGDYLLNFENESYREASEHEFIRGEGRVWFLKRMQEGRFNSPAQMKLNKYVISSRGHVVTIQF